jgi:hypothetical protein
MYWDAGLYRMIVLSRLPLMSSDACIPKDSLGLQRANGYPFGARADLVYRWKFFIYQRVLKPHTVDGI